MLTLIVLVFVALVACQTFNPKQLRDDLKVAVCTLDTTADCGTCVANRSCGYCRGKCLSRGHPDCSTTSTVRTTAKTTATLVTRPSKVLPTDIVVKTTTSKSVVTKGPFTINPNLTGKETKFTLNLTPSPTKFLPPKLIPGAPFVPGKEFKPAVKRNVEQVRQDLKTTGEIRQTFGTINPDLFKKVLSKPCFASTCCPATRNTGVTRPTGSNNVGKDTTILDTAVDPEGTSSTTTSSTTTSTTKSSTTTTTTTAGDDPDKIASQNLAMEKANGETGPNLGLIIGGSVGGLLCLIGVILVAVALARQRSDSSDVPPSARTRPAAPLPTSATVDPVYQSYNTEASSIQPNQQYGALSLTDDPSLNGQQFF